MQVPYNVFRGYDIRGIAEKELTPQFAFALGQALVKYAPSGYYFIVYDARESSQKLALGLAEGILKEGGNVIFGGFGFTELVYFAVSKVSNLPFSIDTAIMVTASHNPKEYNGFKIVVNKGGKLHIIAKQDWPEFIPLFEGFFKNAPTSVPTISIDDLKEDKIIHQKYREFLHSIVDPKTLEPLNIVIDAGNGVGGYFFDYLIGDYAPQIKVKRMYFKPDPKFPNHLPDPLKPENTEEIEQVLKEGNFDFGLAYDGDADRVFLIQSNGKKPLGNYTGVLLAAYLLEKYPNNRKILHDTRMMWAPQKEIPRFGGQPIPVKAGHSNIKSAMNQHKALFALELSSHFYYSFFNNADSGYITTLLYLDIFSKNKNWANSLLEELWQKYPNSGEINFRVKDAKKVIEYIKQKYVSDAKEILEIDGISVEFDNWRFSLRASSTEPLVRLCVEGVTPEVVDEKTSKLREEINEFT